MRALICMCPLVVLVGFDASAADNIEDSFCPATALQQSDPAPWLVDDDINERVPFGFVNMGLSNADVEHAVDHVLQNQARISRAGTRARVLFAAGECSVDDDDTRPCIEAFTNAEDPDLCGIGGAMWGGCGLAGCSNENFQTPRLRLITVTEDGLSASIVDMLPQPGGVDIDNATFSATHALSTDYDFACFDTVTGLFQYAGDCTIVAEFLHDDANLDFARARSIRFRINGTATTAQLLDAGWDINNALGDVNGILGVELIGPSLPALLVTASVPIANGASTTNTRVARIDGARVGGTIVSTAAFRGDAQTCATSAHGETNFGAAAMHGGFSISVCGSCAGGSLQSIGWGIRADGNTNCY